MLAASAPCVIAEDNQKLIGLIGIMLYSNEIAVLAKFFCMNMLLENKKLFFRQQGVSFAASYREKGGHINMDQKEIKKVLELIKQRRSEGFDILYNKYFRFIFGIAYSVLNKESDCYDVIQNVMLRLYAMDERLFPNDHEAAWLHTVVKNEALMYLRREKQTLPLDEVQELPVQDLEIEKFVDMEAFNSITASLNNKQKQIISMKVLGGMTHKEIAKVLSIPIGTVQWIYNRSIKKLRCALGAITGFILFFGAGFVYNLVKYISNAPEEGQIGAMEFNPEPVPVSPWLFIFGVLLLLSIAAFVIFLNFSDKLPTKRKQTRI